MLVWRGFHVICGTCGHKNRPHKQTRQGIALAFLGKLGKCAGNCGHELRLIPDSHRPVVAKVKMALFHAGFIDASGRVIDPPPPDDQMEVVDWRNDETLVNR